MVVQARLLTFSGPAAATVTAAARQGPGLPV